jgi:hypothetical protein
MDWNRVLCEPGAGWTGLGAGFIWLRRGTTDGLL